MLVGDEAATAIMLPPIPRQESANADHPWLLIDDHFMDIIAAIDVGDFGLATDYKIKHKLKLFYLILLLYQKKCFY
jgi:hypothetical protein